MATSLRFYTFVYVLLLALAAAKFLFFEFLPYWDALGLTLVSAAVKTGLIAGYYQHLRHEPRSLTGVMVISLILVFLLGSAATFSIT